jgi:hypothetical protein
MPLRYVYSDMFLVVQINGKVFLPENVDIQFRNGRNGEHKAEFESGLDAIK